MNSPVHGPVTEQGRTIRLRLSGPGRGRNGLGHRVELTRLAVVQYRNFDGQEIEFSAGTNLLVGRNGQGKTNLLEAMYLLGYGKSFRTAVARECIQHGKSEARVEGTILREGMTRELKILFAPSEKKLLLHNKPAPLDEFAGNLHILAFTQEHMKVVRGGPGERRAFLDRAMILLFPGHVRSLASYGRALKQRNALLSQPGDIDEALLESWEEALIQNGVRIVAQRKRYVDQIKKQLPTGLFGNDILKLHYISSAAAEEGDPKEIEENFRRKLRNARNNDRKSGFTSIGPHRDEMKIYINGKALPDFGSAGQQRSGLLSLYFAQMEIHREIHGFYPVFLMDDAEAELDEARLTVFLSYLAERTQTFLTTAKESFFRPLLTKKFQHFQVDTGRIVLARE
jgi:DNA replication and repair protein RecF